MCGHLVLYCCLTSAQPGSAVGSFTRNYAELVSKKFDFFEQFTFQFSSVPIKVQYAQTDGKFISNLVQAN